MLRECLVVDGHMDTPLRILDDGVDIGERNRRVHADLPRMREGGLDAVFLAAWVDPAYAPGGGFERGASLLAAIRGVAERHPERAGFATTAAEVRAIAAGGGIALLAAVENGQALEGDPANVARLAESGARYLTLTWMNSNELGDAAGGASIHGGLSDLGRDVVREMERVGMVVDLAHAATRTFFDALAMATRPVVVSHACTEARGHHPRNVSDDQIRAVAETGGLIGIAFMPAYLDPGAPETADSGAIVDHLERVAGVAGVDHAALGSDLDGIPALPGGIRGVEDLPVVVQELERRGWGGGDLEKVLGGNWLRVIAATDPPG
ncbi:MAG: dipeptidase [Gemmatimonadetes bacterium]|nr:dipeptidase [Gemmatimonadota bacterium]